MLYAELDPFEPVAIQEYESGDGWRVFFRTASQRDRARRALAAEFENALDLHAVDVDDEDWARRSQAALTAARAGRIVVAPPWDVPHARDSRFAIRDSQNSTRDPRPANCDSEQHEPQSGLSNRDPRPATRDSIIIIIIDPSTGFGTGHHATTRLCLELLQELDLRGKRVIDVGTGSGVLAIAAAKLGAREVIGIDTDPDALRNARDNVQRNGVGVELLEEDVSSISLAAADVVVANLTSAVLQRSAESLRKLVGPGGVIIVSGFSPDDLDDVARALNGSQSQAAQAGEWAAASFKIGDNGSFAGSSFSRGN
jgi:ribosomal protein L11 methylase PrmA